MLREASQHGVVSVYLKEYKQKTVSDNDDHYSNRIQSVSRTEKGIDMPQLCPLMYVSAIFTALATATPWEAKDLNPVTSKTAPNHPPVVLVADGKALGSIVAMNNAGAADLQSFIEKATGAKLPIVRDKIVKPAIVLGDCPEAEALGLVSSKMPIEGFAIKTAPGAVFIVGNNYGKNADGRLWGALEFLERFVGVRWYFPPAVAGGPQIGHSIPKSSELSVPPVWIEDKPAFRMRVMWPPMSEPWHGKGIRLNALQRLLRAGNSWPTQLRVHQPYWSKHKNLTDHPEVFQMRKDGKRQHEVICYGHPKTLETYLEGIQNFLDGKRPLYAPINGKAITVSPADVELSCYCKHCRELWDDKAGQYGGASRVMATFVDRLGREIQKRWPKEGFTIIFLPYLNYTSAPEGFKFPSNVEVQICGMPGMASYKEPAIRDSEQANIDRWISISGRRIQNWHYNVWPAHKTKAAYHYPHVVKDFYQRNLKKAIGSFVNGDFNHWPRQHISLYCWLKVLWNPEFDVDAAIDEFARRMFSSAAPAMRKLLALQIDGWEKVAGRADVFRPKASMR
jgi:hypothetical protein